MDADYIKICVTAALAICGWLTVSKLSAWRELRNKRREITLDYLINAYRVLTNDISHRELDTARRVLLENLLADIQLFGSVKQVSLAKQLAENLSAQGSFELDPLINSLRDDLRQKLLLDPIAGNVKWVRFEESQVLTQGRN